MLTSNKVTRASKNFTKLIKPQVLSHDLFTPLNSAHYIYLHAFNYTLTMTSLSPRLSRVAQSAVQSITMSQMSQMLDQTRTSRALHSLFPAFGRAPMQHSLFPSIYRHQVRTQHTTPTVRQRMSYQLDREIQKKHFDYGGLKGESHQIRSSSHDVLILSQLKQTFVFYAMELFSFQSWAL
ncbi:unnamed protein product [Fusarium graminearum]|uniref:Uncharacterized protein n=1 Tax=Gibberella zeae TaxID=5518 RepID=A0A9N8RH95_GIBZA|nr:unnamed protein product [Fusarium graminearum]CAG1992162.1 unnamed protein product [Fusarium graminearum]